MPDVLATNPGTEPQASTERIFWTMDTSPLLGVGESAGSPVVTLIDIATGAAYPAGLDGSPQVVANVISQWVKSLVAGHKYDLVFTFTTSTGQVLSPALRLEVPR